MANFTLTNVERYPYGTVVKAYPTTNWPNGIVDQGAAPVGTHTDSQTMTLGTLTFTGLTPGLQYVAHATVNSVPIYVFFSAAVENSASVSVSNSASTAILAANPRRKELTVINDGANVIYLGLDAAAVANKGIRLAASGGSWTTKEFKGAVNGLALTGATTATFTEL